MLGASETPGFQAQVHHVVPIAFRSSSGSSGVPEPVPEGHAVTFEDSYRVAADGDDDRDINDIACCEFTLPDAGDERRAASRDARRFSRDATSAWSVLFERFEACSFLFERCDARPSSRAAGGASSAC